MSTTLTESDAGKQVRNAAGEPVGRVVDVENGTAYVDPDPGVTDTLLSLLGWADRDDDTDGDSYRLSPDAVETVTDDEILLTEF